MTDSDIFRRYIIVSSSIRHRLELDGEDSGFSVAVEDNLSGAMTELAGNSRGSAVFVLLFTDSTTFNQDMEDLARSDASNIIYRVIVLGDRVPEALARNRYPGLVLSFRETHITRGEFAFMTAAWFDALTLQYREKREASKQNVRLRDAWNDQESLINIGRSLSIEKNPDKLLRTILYLSKKITGADAGSIFIVEKEDDRKFLRFKYSHTFSKDLSYEEFSLPMDTNSIAGYVAVTGEVLNIPDVYDLPADAPISFNPSFDREHGYRTKSMLVLPMRNHFDEMIGVIQLINSKELLESGSGNEAFEVILKNDDDFMNRVCPFDSRYERLMEAVAGQAAIALDNSRMLLQIQKQFDEFVKASVTAIESRDPATSGHSFRVADMCVRTARAVNECQDPPFDQLYYSDVDLKKIEFAALLHDFGKVYLDPSIFLKAKKLYTRDFEYLILRLHYLYRSLELECEAGDVPQQERERKLSLLTEIIGQVTMLNEPDLRDRDPSETIEQILSLQDQLQALDMENRPIKILEDQEIVNLKIRRGSLNDEERRVIESHVEHTYNFVRRIPWPDEYQDIPDIARKHHEKLDGSGYPLGLSDPAEIPLAARIMAIADIFDALNASDRPYKKAVPLEKIYSILREEAEEGKLDGDLVELFIAGKVWD